VVTRGRSLIKKNVVDPEKSVPVGVPLPGVDSKTVNSTVAGKPDQGELLKDPKTSIS
jgi:hypothetical protein